jgi:glycosyltransferase involved in cell wall biosynthesis
MLMGSNRTVKKLRRLVDELKLQSRVFFHPPVEVQDIPQAINVFDLEMVFFPPVTKNLLHALPNKFFEAIQGCLGVVIGDSPNMRAIVEREEIGLVVDGWGKNDLIDALNSLNTENVTSYKLNAAEAAKKFNSEHERSVFLTEIANAQRS